MKFTERFRKYWHDLYYSFKPKARVKFALRCQDAAERIDLGQPSRPLINRVRFQLHLSVCQACKNYEIASRVLKQAVVRMVKNQETSLHKLNQELLKKFSRKTQ